MSCHPECTYKVTDECKPPDKPEAQSGRAIVDDSSPASGEEKQENSPSSEKKSPSSEKKSDTKADAPKPGSMRVRIIKAEKLIGVEKNGTSDPYVKVYLADKHFNTKVIPGTCNPVWDETFQFVTPAGVPPTLVFVIKDYNSLSKSVLLGEKHLDCSGLAPNTAETHTIDLARNRNEYAGRLFVEVEYNPDITCVQKPTTSKLGKMAGKLNTNLGTATSNLGNSILGTL